MRGDWMSVSITPTRRPCAASSAARFAVVFDLPVPPRYECTETMDIRARAYRGPRSETSAFRRQSLRIWGGGPSWSKRPHRRQHEVALAGGIGLARLEQEERRVDAGDEILLDAGADGHGGGPGPQGVGHPVGGRR